MFGVNLMSVLSCPDRRVGKPLLSAQGVSSGEVQTLPVLLSEGL